LKIIFLTYVNRSGSTFMANLLSKSPDIVVCPEGDVLINILLEHPGKIFDKEKDGAIIQEMLLQDEKLKWWNISGADLCFQEEGITNFDFFVLILKAYREKIRPDAEVVVFKGERLIFLYRKIRSLIRYHHVVKMIVMIRDCRAIYNSQHKTYFPGTKMRMADHPAYTALYWNKYIKVCLKHRSDNHFLIVRYEHLLSDFICVFSHLLDLLGIDRYDFLEQKGNYFERIPPDHRLIHEDIRHPPIRAYATKWKNELSAYEINMIQLISGQYIRRQGYEVLTYSMISKIKSFLPACFYILAELVRRTKAKIKFNMRIV